MIKYRLDTVIAGHVRSISDANMDKTVAEGAKKALSDLNEKLAGGKWVEAYRDEVEKAMTAFLRVYNETLLPGCPANVPTRAQLEARRNTLGSVTDEKVIIAADELTARAKVLFEGKDSKRFPELLARFEKEPIAQLFKVADDIVWEQIQNARIQILSFEEDINEPFEAFRPLKFHVTTGDDKLDGTYLFNRGLRFRWRFTLRHWRKSTKQFRPLSRSPRVVQFAPHSGHLTVSVEILRNEVASEERKPDSFWTKLWKKVTGEKPVGSEQPLPSGANQTAQASKAQPKTATKGPMKVRKSLDVGFLRGLEVTEWCALSVAMLLALVSGVLTFYFKNPIFGSVQDYLTLFLWGVGIDQAKNFLQALQSKQSTP
jgi:hypothetical protein